MAQFAKDDLLISNYANGFELRTVHHRANGSAKLSVMEATIMSGHGALPHICTNAEEAICVLAGEFEVSYNGAIDKLRQGDCICYPKGVVRSYKCLETAGRLLFISPHPEPYWDRAIGSGKAKPRPLSKSYIYRASGWNPHPHLNGVARQNFCSPAIGACSTFANMIRIDPGAAVPIHHHPQDDVSLICLKGQIEFMYDKKLLGASAAIALLVEAKKEHGVRNTSSAEAYFLEIHPTDKPKYVYTNANFLNSSARQLVQKPRTMFDPSPDGFNKAKFLGYVP